MSLLHYMMGRGLRRTAGAGETCTYDQILARRPHLAAHLAFTAEQRGATQEAAQCYDSAMRAKATPRWALQRAACIAAVQGNFHEAEEIYATLAKSGPPRDALIRAALLLANEKSEAASAAFAAAVQDALGEGPDTGEKMPERSWQRDQDLTSNTDRRTDRGAAEIESLLDEGTQLLKAGRYVRARETLEKALSTVDLIMSGQAGWVVAETRAAGQGGAYVAPALIETLVPLVQMSDLLLRLLARTCLASNLAEALRRRQLREDLAVWASGGEEITDLLTRERKRIEQAVPSHANHAELHYHLGMVCRALGDLPAAAAAFEKVLKVCPFYGRAVVRLAVTLRQMGDLERPAAVLAKGFDVSAETLRQYYALGLSTIDPKRFDRAVEAMVKDANVGGAADAKANLALALSELGLLDEGRRGWKESAVETAGTQKSR